MFSLFSKLGIIWYKYAVDVFIIQNCHVTAQQIVLASFLDFRFRRLSLDYEKFPFLLKIPQTRLENVPTPR